jgi:hypothetical protein
VHQNQYGHVIYPSIGNFTWSKKKYTFGSQKDENKLSDPKNGIWAPKSVWSCDVSIDQEFYIEQDKIHFWGSNCENKPSEPNNGFWAPKSVWSCDISIDRGFYKEEGNKYFWGLKRQRRKYVFRAQKRNLGPKNIKNKFAH